MGQVTTASDRTARPAWQLAAAVLQPVVHLVAAKEPVANGPDKGCASNGVLQAGRVRKIARVGEARGQKDAVAILDLANAEGHGAAEVAQVSSRGTAEVRLAGVETL